MEYRIEQLLKKGKLWNEVAIEELNKKHIGDIKAKEIVFLCGLGRLVQNKKPYSFNVIVHGASSSGKDDLVKAVLELFPEEDVESFGRVSQKALNYLHNKKHEPNWTYDGKILYLEDVEEAVLNNEVMRVFTAGVTKAAIVGDKKAVVLEVKGKPVVITTTATTIPTEEILNRFSIVKLDESEQQTRSTFSVEEEEYSKDILEFVKGLKSYEVDIPFTKKISKVFPADKVRRRRDFQRFLDLIRAVAVFHQQERRGHSTGTIRAELEDYDIAKEVFMNMYSGVADCPLQETDKRIIEVLEKEKEPISVKELAARMQGYITIQNLYPHLKNLESKGILASFELRDTFNVPFTKYDLSEEFKAKEPIKLPNSIDL